MQTIVQMVKESSTRLKRLVRTMPLDKLKAFIARNTKFTGDVMQAPKDWRRVIRSPRVIAHDVLSSPQYSKYQQTAATDLMEMQNRRATFPSIIDKVFPGMEAAYEKRRNIADLRWFADRGINLNISPPLSGIRTALPAKRVAAIPGAKSVQLPTDPAKWVYKGSSDPARVFLNKVRGNAFVTPHPDIAAGYGNIVRQLPVNKQRFIASSAAGVPMYTPHIGAVTPTEIKNYIREAATATIPAYDPRVQNFEGVLDRLRTKGNLFLTRQSGKFVPAEVRAVPEAAARSLEQQVKQWAELAY